MNTKLLISALAIAAIAAGAGVITENKVGVIDHISSADETLTIEFGSIFEFAATQQFAGAPEYLLMDLATDAVPLASEARQRLSKNPLDANGVQEAIVDMLLDIAGMPESGKDVFMLNTVSVPIMTGANYGKFIALRDGVIEPEEVNKLVTAYATKALDGLLRFLSDLPCPEEASEDTGAASEDTGAASEDTGAEQQLDDWESGLDPAGL